MLPLDEFAPCFSTKSLTEKTHRFSERPWEFFYQKTWTSPLKQFGILMGKFVLKLPPPIVLRDSNARAKSFKKSWGYRLRKTVQMQKKTKSFLIESIAKWLWSILFGSPPLILSCSSLPCVCWWFFRNKMQQFPNVLRTLWLKIRPRMWVILRDVNSVSHFKPGFSNSRSCLLYWLDQIFGMLCCQVCRAHVFRNQGCVKLTRLVRVLASMVFHVTVKNILQESYSTLSKCSLSLTQVSKFVFLPFCNLF